MNRSIAMIGLAAALAFSSAPAASQPRAPWQDVTPREGLAGWRAVGGAATYEVANGELIGRAAPGKVNNWLVSDALYGDFILEYEAKTDAVLNSGVVIRGQSKPDYRNGTVHGYQAEIDPSARAWSGGLYDEQRRQWLYTLARNDAARKAFKPGDWNHYRVEAVGSRIRTWINGVPATDLADSTDARGFFALQVHAVSDEVAAKKPEVRFRKSVSSPPHLPGTRLAKPDWSNRAGFPTACPQGNSALAGNCFGMAKLPRAGAPRKARLFPKRVGRSTTAF